MVKRQKLNLAIEEAAKGKPAPEPSVAEEVQSPEATLKKQSIKPPSRTGTKAITGHFDPAVSKQLKQIALDEDSTIQALLAEALNDLFKKYGKSPIA